MTTPTRPEAPVPMNTSNATVCLARTAPQRGRQLPPITLPPAFEAFCLLHHSTYQRYARLHGTPEAVSRAFGDLATQWQTLLTRRDLTAHAWQTFTRYIPRPALRTAACPGQYDALVLHHQLGCTPAHIAETLGADLPTIRWWLSHPPSPGTTHGQMCSAPRPRSGTGHLRDAGRGQGVRLPGEGRSSVDATLKTVIDGELVELPGTIAGIRATMDPEQAAEFDRQIEHVPAHQLPAALASWALEGTGADEEDDELFDRLARGEDIGAISAGPDSEVA
ncbi:hypothetical protein [Streptomyces smyrnaeus]|uniref:hypothetical protein n=1 Tax=Streptomyces smyrnaeus TaxID=1387713 RepID=UPI0036C56C83